MSTTTFSPTGEDAITRAIDVQVDEAEILDPLTPAFDEFYEISRTAKEIIDGGYKRVRLRHHLYFCFPCSTGHLGCFTVPR
jgi:diphthamide biosynthesis protein 2